MLEFGKWLNLPDPNYSLPLSSALGLSLVTSALDLLGTILTLSLCPLLLAFIYNASDLCKMVNFIEKGGIWVK